MIGPRVRQENGPLDRFPDEPTRDVEAGMAEFGIESRAGPHSADSLAALLRLAHLRHAASSRPLSPAWASKGVRPSRAECGLSLL